MVGPVRAAARPGPDSVAQSVVWLGGPYPDANAGMRDALSVNSGLRRWTNTLLGLVKKTTMLLTSSDFGQRTYLSSSPLPLCAFIRLHILAHRLLLVIKV